MKKQDKKPAEVIKDVICLSTIDMSCHAFFTVPKAGYPVSLRVRGQVRVQTAPHAFPVLRITSLSVPLSSEICLSIHSRFLLSASSSVA